MKQLALLRDWEWLQQRIIPPLLEGQPDQSAKVKVWSVGSMADAIAVTVAFDHAAAPDSERLITYVSECDSSAATVTFGSADLGAIPATERDSWFRREARRWVPQEAITKQVILSEPIGLVDLVIMRTVDEIDSGPDGVPAQDRLRRGGYLLIGEPPASIPSGLRPVEGESRLFQKVLAPSGEQAAPDARPVDRSESLARRKWQQDLVEKHINLARSLARRFAHRGEPIDDLEQVALLALVKAARRFDPGFETAFSTYATVSILGELKRHFRDKTWMLRVPRSTQELYLTIKDAREELSHEHGRAPSVPEIAAHLGVEVGSVLEALEAGGTYWPSSLDVYGPDGERSVDVPVTDLALEGAVDRQQLRAVLPRLETRERLILTRIYFDGVTQQQVAEEIGASQMQVSRLLARTLDKLRQWCHEEEGPLGDSGDRKDTVRSFSSQESNGLGPALLAGSFAKEAP